MKFILGLLVITILIPLGTSAEVAQTYNLEGVATTGIASSVAIDIISHGTDSTGVWLVTGRGINFSYDNGNSWFVYDKANAGFSDNLSAAYSIGGRLWVAANFNQLIGNQLFSLSDGLSYTDDNGLSWTRLDFSPSGLNIPRVEGGDRTIFDIAGHVDSSFLGNRTTGGDVNWLFFTAFAGGLLASQDGGINWRRIWPSQADSVDFNQTSKAPARRNLYFSCVTDTSHGDTLFLWAGTAGGVFQYGYVPPREKYFVKSVKSVAICDTCSGSESGWIVAGGFDGISLAADSNLKFFSRFKSDGLAGQIITASSYIGGRLLVGTSDTLGNSTGLMSSDDQGNSFGSITLPAMGAIGIDNQINDFETVAGRVYLAAQQSGLFVSSDSGSNWAHIIIDSLTIASPINNIQSLGSLSDTLYLGTDSGLVTLFLDPLGNIDSLQHEAILETDSSSSKLIAAAAQNFIDDSTGFQDSVIIWTINKPTTAAGAPAVGRKGNNGVWTFWQEGVNNYDLGFFRDTVFVVGVGGVGFTTRGGDPLLGEPIGRFPVRQFVNDTIVVGSFDADTVTVMEIKGDTVVFGSNNGVAVSTDRGKMFTILRPNQDTLRADFVVNHNFFSSVFGISGDFIPAMGLQYMDTLPARIWLSARPTDLGDPGLSMGEFDTTGQLVWNTVYSANFAWNFEFDGDSVVYAATDDGLIATYGKPDSLNTIWDTIPLIDNNSGEVLVEAGVPVYGVEIIDSFIWVGTDDGTVRIDKNNINNKRLFTYVDSTTTNDEVYAFPVPFAPGRGQKVDFRYELTSDGNVTLEIYDFAMNLVARPIDNIYHSAGIYPSGSSQGYTWDGVNGNGDLVAVGVYYFKVSLPSGEIRWGNLAVIP